MARKPPAKPPAKTSAKAAKASKAPAKSAKAAGSKKAGPKGEAAARKTAKPAAATAPVAKRSAKGAAKAAAPRKAPAAKRAAPEASAKPAARRTTARTSLTRRAAARKTESHEALVKKALAEPPQRARKAAKKPRASKAAKQARAPGAAPGKTARSRIDARAAKKLSSPVLRGSARTPVPAHAATSSRGAKPAAAGRRPPFRLHSLGVRDAHATDWPQVERLLAQAFDERAGAAHAAALRAGPGPALALVAEYEGEIVGYLAFHPVGVENATIAAAALAPLAVAPDRQGKGVGSTLLAAGLEAARSAGFEAVFVNGPPAFFERFGFSAQDAKGFEGPFSGEEFLVLTQSGDAVASGRLVYPAALLP